MDPAKRDILNVSALAKAAGCSRQMVHLSLKGPGLALILAPGQ